MTTSQIRTLFISRSFSYPPIGGAPLRDWQNINIMMKFGPVAVVKLFTDPEHLNRKAEHPPGVELWREYYISDKLPSLQKKVERRLSQVWWLLRKGHPFTNAESYYYVDKVAEELDRVLAEFKPDLVVFEELWLYSYLPVIKRYQCRIILDAHNVETARLHEVQKAEEIKGLKARIRRKIELVKMESIERDFVRQVDRVWACSDRDASLLQVFSQKAPHINVVSNGINIADYDSVYLGNCSLPKELEPLPSTAIFPASFNYKPNILAVELLLNEVYPRIQKAYPNCRLLLVGVNPTQSMLEAAKQDSRIVVTGKVPDMRPYLSASSVVIVPLLQGGGTRLKILEAFAAGRPVVSTSKGAEGLRVRDGEHLLIADSPEELAAAVCRLWSDPSFGQKLADSAYKLVRAEYSWEAIAHRVEQAVRELI